jgi:hypothetical protein
VEGFGDKMKLELLSNGEGGGRVNGIRSDDINAIEAAIGAFS